MMKLLFSQLLNEAGSTSRPVTKSFRSVWRALTASGHQINFTSRLWTREDFNSSASYQVGGILMDRMFLCLCYLLVALYSTCEARTSDLLLPSQREDASGTYILGEPERVFKTDWGEMRVLVHVHALRQHHVGLGFIRMQPKTLLLPHYIDASFVFILQQGSARIGFVYRGELMQQDLKVGDVYAIPAGTLFYLVSTDENQELKVYGVYDTSESLESGEIKAFYIAGEYNLFSGFDSELLGAAFKVSSEGVVEFFNAQTKGAIVPTSLESYRKLTSELETWSWKRLLDNKQPKAPEPLRLFDKKRFENRNGWFASTYGKKLPVLKKSRLGVTAVNLTTEALLAPHWNAQASFFGVVTKGNGTIQIAHPNRTNILDESIYEGSTFFVPRYFPVCIVASADRPFEYVGFTVSDRYHKHGNRPQFLAGTNSVLNVMDMETMALAFNLPEELVRSVLEAQPDKIILSADDLQM